MIILSILIGGCKKPEDVSLQTETVTHRIATNSINKYWLSKLKDCASVEGDRLKFNNEDQLYLFFVNIDSLVQNWQMEPEEDTIETFVHPAIQYIESEFGYKSLQGTYSDEFYTNMDIEEAIPEGRIYFAYMNFALALNDKAEYQIGEKVYKYLSKHEILEVSNIDEELLYNIRTHGFYPDSRIVYENINNGTKMQYTSGIETTQGVCSVVVKEEGDRSPIVSSNNQYTENISFEAFASPNGFANQGVGCVKFEWDYGDGSPIYTSYSGGTNAYTSFVSHIYNVGTYSLNVTATCASNCAGNNCGDVCESFVQSNTLTIIVKNDCPQRQLQKTDNITFSNAGKDYKLQGWLGVETFANFRARAYSDCRFYRKKNGNWKPYKPDGKLGTKLIINRFNYKRYFFVGGSACGNKLNWSSGNINMKHQKDVSENWNSPWQFPGFNNDNYFAATDIVNPTSLTGEYKVIQNGTTQNLNISYIIY